MSKTELKKVNVLGEYVAVMRSIVVSDGVAIDQQALEKLSNEGIVVGIGPEANAGVELGDRVIITKRVCLTLTPASGGYEGKYVAIVKKADLIVKLGDGNEEYTVSD